MREKTTKIIAFALTSFIAFASAEASAALPAPTTPNPGLKYYYPVPKAENPVEGNYDVVVYGGTPAGVGAAVQAKRMGKSAALYVFRSNVGGMT